MKKINLLSRAEMKKVFGGLVATAVGGCVSDSQCSGTDTCCPDHSNPESVDFKCRRSGYTQMPDGSMIVDPCGDIIIDV